MGVQHSLAPPPILFFFNCPTDHLCAALQIFEKLWGTNELLSSFDSINVTAPSAKSGVAHDTRSWLHVDQAPLRRGFFCVQGIVNMVDVGPDTTGTSNVFALSILHLPGHLLCTVGVVGFACQVSGPGSLTWEVSDVYADTFMR